MRRCHAGHDVDSGYHSSSAYCDCPDSGHCQLTSPATDATASGAPGDFQLKLTATGFNPSGARLGPGLPLLPGVSDAPTDPLVAVRCKIAFRGCVAARCHVSQMPFAAPAVADRP